MTKLNIELTDSDSHAASSLSESTGNERSRFSSSSAVRDQVSQFSDGGAADQHPRASLGVRSSWDVRNEAFGTGWDCVPLAAFKSFETEVTP